MKVSRIHRLLRLITLLQSGKSFTTRDLAREIQVSRRTLFRDLNLLRLAGVPLYYDPGETCYSIEKDFFLPPVNFTLPEVLGLMMVVNKSRTQDILPNFREVAGAMTKIESTLPGDLQHYCGSALAKVDFKLTPQTDIQCTRPQFEVLWKAAREQERLQVVYDSYYSGSEIETELDIYKLVFIARAWYAIGFSYADGEVRTYKIERFIDLQPTGRHYELDESFSLSDYFGQAWSMIKGDTRYKVRIRFSPKVAGNVEEVIWHATQQTRRQEDGALLYEVEVDGIHEIAWWVLGYGREAEVLDPPELRSVIAEHVRRMADVYGDS